MATGYLADNEALNEILAGLAELGTVSNLSHRTGRMSIQILKRFKEIGTPGHSALATAGCSWAQRSASMPCFRNGS